jgi:hypothetical protein
MAHPRGRYPRRAGPALAAPLATAQGPLVLWLNARQHTLALATPEMPLLAVLRAHGLPYTLRFRPWREPALRGAPLLTAVAELTGPLEIVVNGALAAGAVTELVVRAGDEVVIGQPWYLRQRFPFFR